EERIASAADREVGREDGHDPAVPPVHRSASPDRPAPPGGHRGAAYCRTGPSSFGGAVGSAGGVADASSSSSPTVFVALPSGRRRVRRSAATSRSRKIIVWPATRSSAIT